MIFTNLALNNIGPYKGKHEFNLKPEVDGVNSKPVILFGGLNGAGKTQILESIKSCLYRSRKAFSFNSEVSRNSLKFNKLLSIGLFFFLLLGFLFFFKARKKIITTNKKEKGIIS